MMLYNLRMNIINKESIDEISPNLENVLKELHFKKVEYHNTYE